jgi:recombination protein RecT
MSEKETNLMTISDVADQVLSKVEELQSSGQLNFPPNYSPGNALKSAQLMILNTVKNKDDKPASEVCTKSSVSTTLLDMVVQGLNPIKKQCYFIVRGNQLTLMRSYFGTIAVTKRLSAVDDIFAQVIYEGDEFEFELNRGKKRVVKHKQKLENIDTTKIIGAYAIIIRGDEEHTEIMNKNQIDTSWKQSSSKGMDVHKKFPEEMAKRTVINRLCKWFVNVSDDSDLLIEAYNRSLGNEYEDQQADSPRVPNNANSKKIDFDEERVVDVPENELKEVKDESKNEKTEEVKEKVQKPVQETINQNSTTQGPGF